MGEEGALSLFRFHLSPFPQKRLILWLVHGSNVQDHEEEPIRKTSGLFLLGLFSRPTI